MNIDELKERWAAYDEKLDSVVRLNHQLLTEATLNRARSHLRRQAAFTIAGALTAWVAIPLLGVFIALNHTSARFVLPAAILILYFIVNMAAQIRRARATLQIDYARPIAAIQKQIEELVLARVRFSRWVFMSMVLTWIPIAIVGCKWLFGEDLYLLAPGWLVANLIVGLAFIPFSLWISRTFAEHSQSPRVRKLLRDIAGSNLTAASEFLATLQEFAQGNADA